MTRPKLRCIGIAVPLLFAGFVLSACSSQSDSLGHQACLTVRSSIKLYDAAQRSTGARRTKLLNEANIALRDALPQAGLAASSDTDWQALAATLEESSRVPESDLVYALSQQCAQTLS